MGSAVIGRYRLVSSYIRSCRANSIHHDRPFTIPDVVQRPPIASMLMTDPPLPLAEWENYYVVVGGAAAALTGLQFVVMALITEVGGRRSPSAIAAFGSPNIVHFSAALLLSAILSAPWPTLGGARIALLALGVGGVVYATIVTRRARRQKDYHPVLEDWIWHVLLPYAAYVATALASVFLPMNPMVVLFVIGAATLLLVCIGIHNAWDTVIYISVGDGAAPDTPEPPGANRSKPQPSRRKAKR